MTGRSGRVHGVHDGVPQVRAGDGPGAVGLGVDVAGERRPPAVHVDPPPGVTAAAQLRHDRLPPGRQRHRPLIDRAQLGEQVVLVGGDDPLGRRERPRQRPRPQRDVKGTVRSGMPPFARGLAPCASRPPSSAGVDPLSTLSPSGVRIARAVSLAHSSWFGRRPRPAAGRPFDPFARVARRTGGRWRSGVGDPHRSPARLAALAATRCESVERSRSGPGVGRGGGRGGGGRPVGQSGPGGPLLGAAGASAVVGEPRLAGATGCEATSNRPVRLRSRGVERGSMTPVRSPQRLPFSTPVT